MRKNQVGRIGGGCTIADAAIDDQRLTADGLRLVIMLCRRLRSASVMSSFSKRNPLKYRSHSCSATSLFCSIERLLDIPSTSLLLISLVCTLRFIRHPPLCAITPGIFLVAVFIMIFERSTQQKTVEDKNCRDSYH